MTIHSITKPAAWVAGDRIIDDMDAVSDSLRPVVEGERYRENGRWHWRPKVGGRALEQGVDYSWDGTALVCLTTHPGRFLVRYQRDDGEEERERESRIERLAALHTRRAALTAMIADGLPLTERLAAVNARITDLTTEILASNRSPGRGGR